MAKKNDPFTEFAEKMINMPKVSESTVSIPDESTIEETAAPATAVPSPARAGAKKAATREKKPALRDDHKAYTVYLRNDLLTKIKTASFKTEMSAKAIINQALDEYFEKHKGIL